MQVHAYTFTESRTIFFFFRFTEYKLVYNYCAGTHGDNVGQFMYEYDDKDVGWSEFDILKEENYII